MTVRVSNSEEERLLFWAGRKAAFSGSRPHLARLLLHGRPHPARQNAAGAQTHQGVRRNMTCAAPTYSMPATAICITHFV